MNEKNNKIEHEAKPENNGLLASLKSYCNKNQQQHAEQPGGWDYYVQNLYLSLSK